MKKRDFLQGVGLGFPLFFPQKVKHWFGFPLFSTGFPFFRRGRCSNQDLGSVLTDRALRTSSCSSSAWRRARAPFFSLLFFSFFLPFFFFLSSSCFVTCFSFSFSLFFLFFVCVFSLFYIFSRITIVISIVIITLVI